MNTLYRFLLAGCCAFLLTLANSPVLAQDGDMCQDVPIITYDVQFEGTLSNENLLTAFCFEGQAGDIVTIEMNTNDEILNPILILSDPATNSQIGEDDNSGEGKNAQLIYSLYRDGLFHIAATSHELDEEDSAGEYELALTADLIARRPTISDSLPITLGDQQIIINRIWQVPELEDNPPTYGKQLVIDAVFVNDSADRHCTKISDLKYLINEEWVIPDINIVRQVRNAYFPNRDYPGTQNPADRHRALCVDSGEQSPTIIVYDIPSDASQLTIDFNLGDEREDGGIILWLREQLGGNYLFDLLKVGETYQIEHEWLEERETETILGFEDIEMENCFGEGSRVSTRTLSRSVERTITISENQIAVIAGEVVGAVARKVIPIPMLDISQMVQSRYSDSESETITFESSESFETPPGTIANYRIEWYLSSIEGNVQVTIGDASFLVPFSMSNQIRVKVDSLPPSECP